MHLVIIKLKIRQEAMGTQTRVMLSNSKLRSNPLFLHEKEIKADFNLLEKTADILTIGKSLFFGIPYSGIISARIQMKGGQASPLDTVIDVEITFSEMLGTLIEGASEGSATLTAALPKEYLQQDANILNKTIADLSSIGKNYRLSSSKAIVSSNEDSYKITIAFSAY
ncbi:hypothetical protein AB751O23_AI_00160 [Chlamydiales bacterium SCGC AB-751-O23]|jgi:hypothetical protein|nr:hypothetical protein AB751O23_AI_00160 [Chlamydiales bacterium SCGC AB-751-O23]